MKRTISEADATRQLEELLESVRQRGDEVVIERDGEPVAVIVPAVRYEALERRRSRLWEIIEQIHAHNADVPEDELQVDIEKAIREVREERYGRAG